MNKTKKLRLRKIKLRKITLRKMRPRQSNKKGGKNKDCKTKCKNKFLNEIKSDKRYKMIQHVASFFTKKDVVKSQAKIVLDDKDIQNDKVFKDCVEKCKK
jgi:hypothetical protein